MRAHGTGLIFLRSLWLAHVCVCIPPCPCHLSFCPAAAPLLGWKDVLTMNSFSPWHPYVHSWLFVCSYHGVACALRRAGQKHYTCRRTDRTYACMYTNLYLPPFPAFTRRAARARWLRAQNTLRARRDVPCHLPPPRHGGDMAGLGGGKTAAGTVPRWDISLIHLPAFL